MFVAFTLIRADVKKRDFPRSFRKLEQLHKSPFFMKGAELPRGIWKHNH